MAIKVLIVDDHTLMRSGLRALLANQPDIEVIGEASDGEEALHVIRQTAPDIVLLDVSMPGMNGLACLKRMKEAMDTKVILLTMHEDPKYLHEGFALGAMGYILKRAADEVLYQAIRTVQAGEIYLQPAMAKFFIPQYQKKHQGSETKTNKQLSEQERRVLSLIATGYSNAEIADRLEISIKTVETYKYRIMEKLNAKKRSDLVKYALEHGITNLE